MQIPNVTDIPEAPTTVVEQHDMVTKISFTMLNFSHAGDIKPTRGPSNFEISKLGGLASYNVFDKDASIIFTNLDGEHESFKMPAFYNSDYAGRKDRGPFYLVAAAPDTNYFCVMRNDKPFYPVEVVEIDMEEGQVFDSAEYIGWNLLVLKGRLSGGKKVGAFIRLESGANLTATEDTKIVMARKKLV